ncbi:MULTISPECIES: DNA-3-methyladenine glycosylase family protein [Aneurinibacillus]|uniref:DNA-3-methyladenine glycosylase II n=1 Tax=Aneurinibacillus thermoaerophilus TaxID=143495 RepID=A0A1G7XDE8_ANETH|nr:MULTISPECIES: DNA-3-methyladenine glycosylase [Aneurinibacillus]AMA73320.1 hypothetical protein ACH33_10955 [Aneurinibacillus sp. XH2]MED0677161.1 DNA-3-methyladenine glycosylase [Aneurinibacillus thermoaerophilus]MED0736225.1 DNA-3-methyladenine glycosylase [Aneurinibacillus thermoaerophilus]MED0758578.1 DNA-3-methyladenine glycosylase [Aneurinibacillus thermoaerophilus]MED0760472.1 DNA-3-methyladenine glycosylase [Aneurinibacillus thermoaerophilus]
MIENTNEQAFAEGVKRLAEKDPIIGRLIDAYGRYPWKTRTDYFAILCESIVSQQLSVKAAAAIAAKVRAYFSGEWAPQPILAAGEEELRACGLSYLKIRYLKDLAAFFADGRLKEEEFPTLSNEEVVRRLVQVKGIGVWTAQMFLLFGLGRLNVFPVDDLGIKKAIQFNYDLPALPDKKQMIEIGAKWTPYESIACLYLWRSLNNKPEL